MCDIGCRSSGKIQFFQVDLLWKTVEMPTGVFYDYEKCPFKGPFCDKVSATNIYGLVECNLDSSRKKNVVARQQ